MDENDAITWIKTLNGIYRAFPREVKEALDTAIKALEEIKQYRENGYTIDRVLTMDCDYTALNSTLEDYGIESSERLYEVLERQKPKKPIEGEYGHDWCPNCGWIVYQEEYGGRYLPHCENCGQAIDWYNLEG